MRHIARFLAKTAGQLSRVLGRGGGTSIPGTLLMKLRPRTLQEMARELDEGIVVISATNGKTTTTRMISNIAQKSGLSYVTNASGANLTGGIASALLEKNPEDSFGIFEIDEAALPDLVNQLEPTIIILMNLFRDQLDRYGELETTLLKWAEMIRTLPATTKLLINADDPALAYLGALHTNVEFFGVGETQYGSSEIPHAADSLYCQKCDGALLFSQTTIGQMGHWKCQKCDLERPEPSYTATAITLKELKGAEFKVTTALSTTDIHLPLAGLHNIYNALVACAVCATVNISSSHIQEGLGSMRAAFGRNEVIDYQGLELLLLLAKNPAGANQNLKTVLLSQGKIHLAVLLNDRTADGQDVSWIWDVDYEMIFDRIASLSIGGDRAYDMALRFYYSGFPLDQIHIATKVKDLLSHLPTVAGSNGKVIIMPTYTAMLDLRSELSKAGTTHSFWEEK